MLAALPLAPRRDRIEAAAPYLFCALYAAALVLLAGSRDYLGFGVESDYLGLFVPEAERFLQGQPLLLEFHPPLYSMVIAAAYRVVGDWMTAGLIVSVSSAFLSLIFAYLFASMLWDKYAGWGAVLGLVLSRHFVAHSIYASSDVFFLMLFIASCCLALNACLFGATRRWFVCGAISGLALLARSNGITLALLAVLPLICRAPPPDRWRNCLAVLAGMLLPLVAWFAYALLTGSNTVVQNNHLNLALTFLVDGPDRVSYDAFLQIRDRFDGIFDVLAEDPVRLVTGYVANLIRLVAVELAGLLEFPANLLFAPGILFLLLTRWSRLATAFWLLALAQVLLVSLKAFDPRFLLFLLPFLGAGLPETCRRIAAAAPHERGRKLTAMILVVALVGAGSLAFARGYRLAQRNEAELAEVVPIARKLLERDAVIVSRKPHIPWETAREQIYFPNVATLAKLRSLLRGEARERPVYLYYGSSERAFRPQFESLGSPAEAPDWLVAVAGSRELGRWVLYRYGGAGSEGG